MLRLLRWTAMAALSLTVSACATMNVSSHVEHGIDFAQYKTWQWVPADTLPESDARLNSPFFQDHVLGAVEKEMAARGLVQTWSDNGEADLLVHYHANLAPRVQVASGGGDTGACYDADCRVRVFETQVDSIIVDVVDARTDRLIWRGWAQNATAGSLDRPERMEKRIREAVARMFTRFPRTL